MQLFSVARGGPPSRGFRNYTPWRPTFARPAVEQDSPAPSSSGFTGFNRGERFARGGTTVSPGNYSRGQPTRVCDGGRSSIFEPLASSCAFQPNQSFNPWGGSGNNMTPAGRGGFTHNSDPNTNDEIKEKVTDENAPPIKEPSDLPVFEADKFVFGEDIHKSFAGHKLPRSHAEAGYAPIARISMQLITMLLPLKMKQLKSLVFLVNLKFLILGHNLTLINVYLKMLNVQITFVHVIFKVLLFLSSCKTMILFAMQKLVLVKLCHIFYQSWNDVLMINELKNMLQSHLFHILLSFNQSQNASCF